MERFCAELADVYICGLMQVFARWLLPSRSRLEPEDLRRDISIARAVEKEARNLGIGLDGPEKGNRKVKCQRCSGTGFKP